MDYNIINENDSIGVNMDHRDYSFEYLRIGLYKYKNGQHIEMTVPRPFDIITKILSGSVVFCSDGQKIPASAGEAVFIPMGTVYSMTWYGDEPRNAVVHYKLKNPDKRYAMQRIENADLPLDGSPSEVIEQMILAYRCIAISHPLLRETESGHGENRAKAAEEYIRKHYTEEITTKELASAMGLSPSRFYSVFKRATGTTAVEYRNKLRCEIAMRLLISTNASIEQLSDKLGFSSAVYFRRVFKSFTGVSCTEYRKTVRKAENELI